MLLPVALLVPVAASLTLYSWFRGIAAGKTYWSTIAGVTLGISAVRVGGVGLGVYILGHDSGWWQVPAYAMTLLGLPEASLMRPLDTTPQTLVQLGTLLLAGTGLWVGAIALMAARRRR